MTRLVADFATLGGQNNHKLVVNTPDLSKLLMFIWSGRMDNLNINANITITHVYLNHCYVPSYPSICNKTFLNQNSV